MFFWFCSARHCQFVAAMAFVRRFCTSELGHPHAGKQLSRKATRSSWLGTSACNPLINPALSITTGRDVSLQHIFFSRLRPTGNSSKAGTCPESLAYPFARSASGGGRSSSLHWDRRETSLMCLKDSTPSCSEGLHPPKLSPHQGEGATADELGIKDSSDREPPVLFSVERSTVNHVLSLLTSSLHVQDGLKDITATLRRLSATMHVQSIMETAAKPWDVTSSDDIIIRNNPPNEQHGANHILNNWGTGRQDSSCQNQLPSQLEAAQSLKSTEKLPALDVGVLRHAEGIHRTHLYFNKVYHVPMVAAVPEPNHLQSSTGDLQPPPAKPGSGLTKPDSSTVSPQDDNGAPKPSKEQILVMYERLEQELPNFLNESHDFSMYASTVEFDNRIMRFKTKGLPAYKASIQGLKYLCAAYVTGSTMEVLRITAELELGQIQARWRVRGVPLHSYVIRPWRRKHPDRYFDAFSTFELGSDGLIHRHKMDKVMPTPSDKVRAPSLAMRIGIALGLARNPALAPDCMVPKHLSFIQPKAGTGKL
ncbi:uncharacterized protein LOC110975826 isoform X2 [Acanthaster planci]|uniref:Uncharacterized protein LOC110975826 isoform X2 n=1 Tax=Acanthaster planci TaxID=133434 RepID=A0A8B7XWZ8_ACAPL|nr:uncharacterized protein LOC110975826 isoform X2 [Acanthaster planci]